jgi:hypothetical protein
MNRPESDHGNFRPLPRFTGNLNDFSQFRRIRSEECAHFRFRHPAAVG